MAYVTNPKVDEFLHNEEKWRAEFEKLREILLASGLTEELKWGVPCYTSEGKNVALIHGFKDYCAILFVKGSLFKDEKGLLIQQTGNVQAGRQIRFTSAREVEDLKAAITDYIQEAIGIEKAGLSVDFKKAAEFAIPEELQAKFGELPALKAAFEALTPGRQRAYLLHFAEPKQSKTRAARVEKYAPQILEGRGMYD
jgi:uncharacterized protein YdeI (YjbR/CyaY-like superfamily)